MIKTPKKFSKTPGFKKPLIETRFNRLRQMVPKVQRKEVINQNYLKNRTVARQNRQIITLGHFTHPIFTEALLKTSLKKSGVSNPENFIKRMLKKQFEIASLNDTLIKMIESRSLKKATEIKKDYNKRIKIAQLIFQEKYNTILSNKINQLILNEFKNELIKNIEEQIMIINSFKLDGGFSKQTPNISKSKESASSNKLLLKLNRLLSKMDKKSGHYDSKLDYSYELSLISKELKKFYKKNETAIYDSTSKDNFPNISEKILSIEKFQFDFNQRDRTRKNGYIPSNLKTKVISFVEQNHLKILKEVFNPENKTEMKERAVKEFGLKNFFE